MNLNVPCPDCGARELEILPGAGPCDETGYVDPDYVHCAGCGANFDIDELDRILHEPERDHRREAA